MSIASNLGNFYGKRLFSSYVMAVFILVFTEMPALAKVVPDKTPDDVFQKVIELSEKIQWLRRYNKVTDPWPGLARQFSKEPRHVLRKALEVLGKINRYRLIKGMGAISTSHFPGRDITPNEVFSMVRRLVDEVNLLLPVGQRGPNPRPPAMTGHTSSDVYRALWEASRGLDPVLGIRGFNPSDVYAQSQQVVALVKILRQSQNLPLDVAKPELGKGHHPNHALASVYRLQKRVSMAEQSLWMTPVDVPVVPRRIITPTEVYDATETVLAELQRIQFRLGLERNIDMPQTQHEKTPDDVIQNLDWAARMMPQFPPDKKLIQSDRILLRKTPDHVFALTEHILGELGEYRKVQNILVVPRLPPATPGRKPRHVYQKTLEAIEKVAQLRSLAGLYPSAVPIYPMRAITPAEVFDLVVSLEEALHIIYRKAGISTRSFLTMDKRRKSKGKTPGDVYLNVWKISLLLDTVLGKEGFTPSDVYRESQTALAQIRVVGNYLGRNVDVSVPEKKDGTIPRTVYKAAAKLLNKVHRAQSRSGMFFTAPSEVSPGENVTPSQVFNLVRIIQTEMTAMKVHLGIMARVREPAIFTNKEPGDVLQVLEQALLLLEKILRDGSAGE